MSTWARLAPVIALWLLCGIGTGCASSLRLTLLAAAAGPSRDVALYMDVADAQGQPVTGLQASDFHVFDDGQLISPTLANQELAATHFTLLLIELSSAAVMSDQVGAIRAAAEAWLAQVQPYQRVAVYAFDGAKTLHEIITFQGSSAQNALAALPGLEVHDPATNLHGAILLGLAELGRAIRSAQAALRFGTLVVLTDGLDRANRISQRQMLDAVEAAPYRVFTLGIGRELDDSVLSRVGKTGYIRVDDSASARSAFRELAELITRATRRQYLLRFCAAARAGGHPLTIRVNAPAGSGQLQYAVAGSTGHAPCDLTRVPTLTAVQP